MKTEIQELIAEASRQTAFNCFKKNVGQFDKTKADHIAGEFADKIIEAAAPCKNKMEELQYELNCSKADIQVKESTILKLKELIVSQKEPIETHKQNLSSIWKTIKSLWT